MATDIEEASVRVPQPEGCRGSLRWIRRLVAGQPELLEDALRRAGALTTGATIDWRSPREADDWAEYRDGEFLDLLGYSPLTRALSDFWPRGGPQWDALGRSTDGVLFLVEAKAHIGELRSSCAATASASRARIASSLARTRDALGISGGSDWLVGYYQYANRLAHLGFLRDQGVPTYLVFVYFLGDTQMPGAPITRRQWEDANRALKSHLGSSDLPAIPGVIDLYFDVSQLRDTPEGRSFDGAVEHYPAGYPYAERFDNLSEVFVGEGGAVYVGDGAEGFAVVTDESTTADILGEELGGVTVRLFQSREGRDSYIVRLRERTIR